MQALRRLDALLRALIALDPAAGCDPTPRLIGATVGGGAGVTNVAWNGVTEADGFVLDYPDQLASR
jgi:hypothetical protein